MNLKKTLILAGFVLTSLSSQAQIYNYYQIFIYNFAKYIQWPEEKQNGDFVIAVLGDCPIIEKLENMASTKKLGSQPIKIEVYQNANQVGNCHMLFIPKEKSQDLEVIKEKVRNNSTLIITEEKDLGIKGSNINFVVVDGKLRFELNKLETEKSNLKVSTDLTKLAILI